MNTRPDLSGTATAGSPAILDQISSDKLPFGWLAYLGAAASLVVCYGKTILLGTVGAFGIAEPQFNPHLQAALMWGLGTVAVYGLYRDREAHRKNYPLILGVIGVLIIIATLYTFYKPSIEMSGYIVLVVAALLNQNAMLIELNRAVAKQAEELEEKTRELERLNSGLEETVSDQVSEIERLARLRRFLTPEVANLVTTENEKSLLESHRQFIAALFCDIRGFTGFSESMEPEEVMNVLRQYHETMGEFVAAHQGTIDHRAGDGLMVFFNDPLPCEAPVLKAVTMSLQMRAAFDEMNGDWRKRGYQLGFGVGIASGYATLGIVGYEGRFDYTANGNVVNLASRLCDQAEDGQILMSHKAYIDVESEIETDPLGEMEFRGFTRPVQVYNVTGHRQA